MEIFELNKVILQEVIDNRSWVFRVGEINNPTQEEIDRNREFNDSLGNYEPEHLEMQRPTSPFVKVVAESEDGEVINMWWDPGDKIFGPHISKKGWSKGLFNTIKGKLANWKIAT